jgi:hypothetical protein
MSTLATMVTFSVGWPSSTAGNAGTGNVNILLLSNFTGTTTLTGTAQSCGLVLPDLTLNTTGMAATGGGSKIQIQVKNAAWDAIKRTFPVTGTQSGFNIGDSLDTNASIGLLGLTDASGYGTASKAWPPYCNDPSVDCSMAGSFMASDLQDDDKDNKPAITATPLNNSTYALPPTKALFAPVANEVYIVSRNEIAIKGMHATDCTHGTGTATISLFDNHVVGCTTVCPSGLLGCSTGTTPQKCTSAQISFLDQNRTIYGYDQNMGDVISSSHTVTGMVQTVQLPTGSNCAAARAAFGSTFAQQ